jgi:hypothetical protein
VPKHKQRHIRKNIYTDPGTNAGNVRTLAPRRPVEQHSRGCMDAPPFRGWVPPLGSPHGAGLQSADSLHILGHAHTHWARLQLAHDAAEHDGFRECHRAFVYVYLYVVCVCMYVGRYESMYEHAYVCIPVPVVYTPSRVSTTGF